MESSSIRSKIYLIFFAIFFILVATHWLINSLKELLGFPFWRGESDSSAQLAEINFNFFPTNIKKNYLSQGYGATSFAEWRYPTRWHNGIDIAAILGAPVLSAGYGQVFLVGDQDKFCPRHGYGKFVVVKDATHNSVVLYAHLSAIKAKIGDNLKRSQILGLVGASGFATAPHLHFSVFKGDTFHVNNKKSCGPDPEGKDINPITYLNSLKKEFDDKGKISATRSISD